MSLTTDCLTKLTGKEDELKNFEIWINDYNICRALSWMLGYHKPDVTLLKRMEEKLLEKEGGRNMDFNGLFLHLANESFQAGDLEQATLEYGRIQSKNLDQFMKFTFFGLSQASFSQVAVAVAALFSIDKKEKANELIKSFPSPVNRATLYAFAAKELAFANPGSFLLPVLLDSCRKEIDRDESHNNIPRIQFAYALSMRGEENDMREANQIMKNVSAKSPGLERMCRSMSYHGDLSDAWQFIPDNISDDNRASYLAEILYGQTLAQKNKSAFWKKYEEGRWIWFSEFLFYAN